MRNCIGCMTLEELAAALAVLSPPCPDPMTRAALVALRNAGSLDPQCHYVVTDWVQLPNLPGPNLIELHAVNASSLAQAVKVRTPLDNTAWSGQYDIDLDAAGRMLELNDNLGNTVRDAENTTNIIGVFPWGNTNWRENFLDSVTLTTGATSLTRLVTGNTMKNSIINLALWAGGSGHIIETEFESCSVTCGPGVMTFWRSKVLDQAAVNLAGTGLFTLTNSTLATVGTLIASNAAATGAINIQGSTLDDGVVVRAGPLNVGGAGLSFTNARCHGRNVAALNGDFYNNGTGAIVIIQSDTVQASVQNNGGANITLNQANVTNSTIFRNAASVAKALVIGNCDMRGCIISLNGNTAGAQIQFTRGVYHNVSMTDLGNNNVTIADVMTSGLSIQIAAGVTRGLSVTGGSFSGGVVRQNSTGSGALIDQVIDCRTLGASASLINFNVTDPGAPSCGLRACSLTDSVVNVGNPGAAPSIITISGCEILGGSTLNYTGPGLALNGRLLASTVTTGGFQFENTIIETGFTKTLTGANVNRLANKAFDDII